MADLNSLIVFAYVVEANSFSGAARILKMPTSTVSAGDARDCMGFAVPGATAGKGRAASDPRRHNFGWACCSGHRQKQWGLRCIHDA
jgi:hypothetical protein